MAADLIKRGVKEQLLDGDAVHVVLDDERFVGSKVVQKDFAGRGPDAEVEAVSERECADLRQARHLKNF